MRLGTCHSPQACTVVSGRELHPESGADALNCCEKKTARQRRVLDPHPGAASFLELAGHRKMGDFGADPERSSGPRVPPQPKARLVSQGSISHMCQQGLSDPSDRLRGSGVTLSLSLH